jgi:hypothetical protein
MPQLHTHTHIYPHSQTYYNMDNNNTQPIVYKNTCKHAQIHIFLYIFK